MSAISEGFALWRDLRGEFELVIWSAYERAEEGTGGALLNERGRAAGIDPVSLMFGPRARAHAYASEELLEHWEKFPRITFAEYERQRMRELS